ncbi:hypothetical protein CEXT_197801 [Caerostris extrusa]|uniref:Uncharacterized protein n=1 Tax=Caerostris extrusa TaxID=172846 RepID=A0AAV4TYX5_CAEEX|nr:hypothetical protein CEXT_197801 [Caerostris extrusa]
MFESMMMMIDPKLCAANVFPSIRWRLEISIESLSSVIDLSRSPNRRMPGAGIFAMRCDQLQRTEIKLNGMLRIGVDRDGDCSFA